ncbi:phage tail assembly chaperone [Altererythrobacter arenosus]|uniref:Phage tail assembly chaperone n=1 Tax=Altererythrobacter arenosus TaxID=3032592 RepID=A0ABY8FV04_9SPHN|nr:phage tail assembly chaperone [Altererythrobacter sp. CAU 1644]WFL78837.1 phage tail assembly chaperone [Altererythrobacter sp. CAU 1644]
MSDTFARSARELAAVSAQALGWKPDEFWRATPEELATSLADPRAPGAEGALSRSDLETLMERDRNG